MKTKNQKENYKFSHPVSQEKKGRGELKSGARAPGGGGLKILKILKIIKLLKFGAPT